MGGDISITNFSEANENPRSHNLGIDLSLALQAEQLHNSSMTNDESVKPNVGNGKVETMVDETCIKDNAKDKNIALSEFVVTTTKSGTGSNEILANAEVSNTGSNDTSFNNTTVNTSVVKENDQFEKTDSVKIIAEPNQSIKVPEPVAIQLNGLMNSSEIQNGPNESLPHLLTLAPSITDTTTTPVVPTITNTSGYSYNSSSNENIYSNMNELGKNGIKFSVSDTMLKSNKLPNNSTSKPQLYKDIRSFSSMTNTNILPPTSNDRTTVTVKMFQRMDELSARMIAMEEMLEKLCGIIEHQNTTITDLKQTNNSYFENVTERMNLFQKHLVELNTQTPNNDHDIFAMDLLNSITNVSSAYLRKMKSKNNSTSSSSHAVGAIHKKPVNRSSLTKQFSTPDLSSVGQSGFKGQINVPGRSTFTLNPNGIKRRKKVVNQNDFLTIVPKASRQNHSNTNVVDNKVDNNSITNSYPDISSLNSFSTVSLPNLTLENTGITPLIKGSNGHMFEHPNSHPTSRVPTPLLPVAASFNPLETALNRKVSKKQKPSSGSESNNELIIENHDDDDDDGYQEDDDDDNDNENENDNDFENDRARKTEVDPKKKSSTTIENTTNTDKTLKSIGLSMTRSVSKGEKADKDQKSHTEAEHNDSVEESSEALNYTLLKAPSSVRTIWEEYVHGKEGCPSVKQLEEKYGNKWRVDKNRKTFARRKRLYKFILKGIEKGNTADEMIRILEDRRLYRDEKGNLKRRTIGWLQQSLSGT
ncbi:hypothetical protein Kpol_1002p32 [Vanderwaltozyma polyspora DSM 70294]|uniref:Transcription activator GCR1-like domain-containing protein n=1 Tax=Vanderwaltozyma polyspora (strain ATCC 22028 / DSM 70294 / BCRC 21397 / CBS 2163 / NBRC 10782 / NRRL Y-8283 / UCD 57-17) TaxID=436907 RepID=A7TE63_VANPO|nr:uncharacterized protein Kpol_1002p32 [Vanderwaltozyma polyspora DSM 70294]EDO19385.1 hypothetical protein Kpol_1002p32 [Vanderwaltozyma polyspora DSM 70294]